MRSGLLPILRVMATDEVKQGRIDEIDEMLATGVTAHTVDGVSMTIDHNSLRKERAKLVRELNSSAINSSINISGAFG